jgi:hypothetical protein
MISEIISERVVKLINKLTIKLAEKFCAKFEILLAMPSILDNAIKLITAAKIMLDQFLRQNLNTYSANKT